MIYKTIHPLPFLSIALKSAYQDDLELDALCVFVRVPSTTARLAVVSTSEFDLEVSDNAEKILQHVRNVHFPEDPEGLDSLLSYTRKHFADLGSAVLDWSSLSRLRDNWGEAMQRWNDCLDDGHVIPALADEAAALIKLTTKIPTPPGPLRASEAVFAFAGFLPTQDDRCTNNMEALMVAFCDVHELRSPRPGYHGLLRQFVDKAPAFMIVSADFSVGGIDRTVSPEKLAYYRADIGPNIKLDIITDPSCPPDTLRLVAKKLPN